MTGIKLDNKACESLESIFRRIRFEVVDFENCGLEEEVSILYYIILYYIILYYIILYYILLYYIILYYIIYYV